MVSFNEDYKHYEETVIDNSNRDCLTLGINDVIAKVLEYIMALAPIGVFCMLTPVVVTNGPSVLGSYAALIAMDYGCFIFHAVAVYASLVWLLGRMSPLRFFRGMRPAMLFAFSATVASIGTPGIPGGALALMAMVFASAGIPIEGVAVAAGIDRIVDMGRTVMSITGDASCAVVLQKQIGEKS